MDTTAALIEKCAQYSDFKIVSCGGFADVIGDSFYWNGSCYRDVSNALFDGMIAFLAHKKAQEERVLNERNI